MRRLLSNQTGATLIEILVATAIMGLVAAGLFAGLQFGKTAGWRSETEMEMGEYAQRIAEELRTVVNGPRGDGLSLAPGMIYVNANPVYDDDPAVAGNQNPPNPCIVAGAPAAITALDVPANLQRFNVRIRYYVEDAYTQVAPNGKDDQTAPSTEASQAGCNLTKDRDGNGTADDCNGDGTADSGRGQDLDCDGTTDLIWTHILIDWDSPTTD